MLTRRQWLTNALAAAGAVAAAATWAFVSHDPKPQGCEGSQVKPPDLPPPGAPPPPVNWTESPAPPADDAKLGGAVAH